MGNPWEISRGLLRFETITKYCNGFCQKPPAGPVSGHFCVFREKISPLTPFVPIIAVPKQKRYKNQKKHTYVNPEAVLPPALPIWNRIRHFGSISLPYFVMKSKPTHSGKNQKPDTKTNPAQNQDPKIKTKPKTPPQNQSAQTKTAPDESPQNHPQPKPIATLTHTTSYTRDHHTRHMTPSDSTWHILFREEDIFPSHLVFLPSRDVKPLSTDGSKREFHPVEMN